MWEKYGWRQKQEREQEQSEFETKTKCTNVPIFAQHRGVSDDPNTDPKISENLPTFDEIFTESNDKSNDSDKLSDEHVAAPS
jgi:hypothetical protein